MRTTFLTTICFFFAVSLSAQTKRAVTFDDVMKVKAVGGPVISPDGTQVIYTVRSWEPNKELMEARTHIWKAATNASAPARQITFGEKGESQPQWSPDGKSISFVATRPSTSLGAGGTGDEAKAQIYVMRADGGEAWKLTDSRENVSSYSWAPDSAHVAYVAVDSRSADEDANIKKRDDERVFEGDFRFNHAWVIDVATKEATRITSGTGYTVAGAPSWAPDSRKFVFGAGTTPMLRDNRRDIYIADIAAKQIEKISPNFGSDAQPKWSPDGKLITWVSEPDNAGPIPDGTATSMVMKARLMMYDVTAKTIKDVSAPNFDTDAGNPTWTAEGKRVTFVAGRRAYNEAFAYDITSGAYSQLSQRRTLNGQSVSTDGKTIVVTMDSPSSSTEVFATDPSYSSFRQLTNHNPQIAELALGETEVITWKSTDGVEVEGVVLKPVGFKAGVKYPTLVIAHGGPSGAYVNNNRMGGLEGGQVWANNGWMVFYPNPRGSTNYGEQFLKANLNDWGGGDFKDINTGVDALIAKGYSDPDKLAHIGWSYGGYMTAWTVTQTTRYKAAMVGAGLTNMWSMYGTNDIPSVLITYFGGIPNAKTLPLYMDRSALTHVDKVTTPTLILHGSNDERVPIGQPMEFYRALKDRGKITELVFYPREPHGFSEYYHQKDRMQRIYDWVTKYTLKPVARRHE
jgi:dipeptidyl aminopeptidase/acylaminoacyl peptidase